MSCGDDRIMTRQATGHEPATPHAPHAAGEAGPAGGRTRWFPAWLCMFCACGTATSQDLARQCQEAADGHRGTAADLCLRQYNLTHDPEAGSRAARALQTQGDALPTIERIANAIGDRPAGADAWLAAGVSRGLRGDVRGSLAAYERAVAMRGARDTLGQLHDAVGLLYYYNNQSDYRAATRQAAIAYDLLSLVERQDDRAVAYLNIATVLAQIGNLTTTASILDEARCTVPVTSPYYANLRQLDAFVEGRRDHPASQRQALLEARALAIRDGNRALEWDTRANLIELEIKDGQLDDAAALLDFRPVTANASANDRATFAYLKASLAMARGNHRAAVQLIERVLPEVPDSWIGGLEGVRGRALLQDGQSAQAERALRRSVEAIERAREALDNDTSKSALLADQRAPFEDLFLIHVSTGRLKDALAVVQRATARSTLDGLLATEPGGSSMARSIIAIGEWSEGMHRLAPALRSSRAAITPPIETLLKRLRENHIITYFRASRDLWAISIAGDSSLRVMKIGATDKLAERVAAWRSNMEDAGIAGELGAMLLPDELMPPSGTPLYIVQEDPIADVAFAALRRHGELVLEHHAVAYAPSAAVLSATRRSQAPVLALVLGDPKGNLPQARQEAKEVAARLHVAPRLGADATRASVLEAGDATLIHIAAHTVPTDTGAALQLSDGLLDAGTVLDHGVAVGAIVLLTCSSAPITSRDELSALASAFVAAGAHTVVASRWSVPDGTALSFARTFYQENGITHPVAALATAQRELVRKHVPVSEWATFAILGGLP